MVSYWLGRWEDRDPSTRASLGGRIEGSVLDTLIRHPGQVSNMELNSKD